MKFLNITKVTLTYKNVNGNFLKRFKHLLKTTNGSFIANSGSIEQYKKGYVVKDYKFNNHYLAGLFASHIEKIGKDTHTFAKTHLTQL